jgi:hypothetical protein
MGSPLCGVRAVSQRRNTYPHASTTIDAAPFVGEDRPAEDAGGRALRDRVPEIVAAAYPAAVVMSFLQRWNRFPTIVPRAVSGLSMVFREDVPIAREFPTFREKGRDGAIVSGLRTLTPLPGGG